ncbi:UNVERIFIED_ORG: hypothetical protein GGE44_003914 [Rhizobium esperanzae]
MPLSHMSWHWGGSYNVPESARSILEIDDGRGSLFLDFPALPGGGRLLLSTLDPHSHNGQRFMPATTRFLRSFYPWLNRELSIERPLRNRFTYLQCSHVPSEWQPDGLQESSHRPAWKPRSFRNTSSAPGFLTGRTRSTFQAAMTSSFSRAELKICSHFSRGAET